LFHLFQIRLAATRDSLCAKIGFQDELRALLRRHEFEGDEKYLLGLIQPQRRRLKNIHAPATIAGFTDLERFPGLGNGRFSPEEAAAVIKPLDEPYEPT
jgi:hypothetical protein